MTNPIPIVGMKNEDEPRQLTTTMAPTREKPNAHNEETDCVLEGALEGADAAHDPSYDFDFVKQSYLTYAIPATTNIDLEQAFKDVEAGKSILESIQQRDSLFFGRLCLALLCLAWLCFALLGFTFIHHAHVFLNLISHLPCICHACASLLTADPVRATY